MVFRNQISKFSLIITIFCFLLFLAPFLNMYIYGADVLKKAAQTFDIISWKVGQFVEYQIITVENESRDNRYKFSLIGKEQINNAEYFWIQADFWEYTQYKTESELKNNITLQMLVPSLTVEEFNQNLISYIANGFLPINAERLKIRIYDGPFIETDPKSYFSSHQDIIEDTLYSIMPEAMGKIDFSRMRISIDKEEIAVPAGTFKCDHIFVNTDRKREYHDEGFDLWRSSQVPLLGIVKMEFSKTLYWDKWSYRNENKNIKTIKDFFSYLYNKRVLGRRRPDTHIINLINYGENS